MMNTSTNRRHVDTLKPTGVQNHTDVIGDMDISSDFSGGCSPYKAIARNASGKLKVANHKRGICKVTRSAAKSIKENLVGQERMNTVCNELNVGVKVCKICGLENMTSDMYKCHLKQCLKNRFNRSTKPFEEGSVPVNTETSTSSVRCETIPSVDKCTNNELYLKAVPHSSRTEVTEQTRNVVCDFCGQNLEHLTHHRCIQHLNRCLDKMNEKAKKDEEIKEAILNKILDCPLCGQTLKTSRSRHIHLKRCAKKLEVSGPVLHQCIRQQEEEYKLKLEAGILLEEGIQQKRRHKPNRKKKTGQANPSSRSVVLSEPQSKLDEETQLALALSESLRADTDKLAADGMDGCAEQRAPVVAVTENMSDCPGKDAFSLLMTPKHDERGPRKKQRKRANLKTTYKLETETKVNRVRKLEHKIGLLVSAEGMTESCTTTRFEPSTLAKKFSSEAKTQDLGWWFLSSQPNGSNEMYYVKELQSVIVPSNIEAGSKLKSMLTIPGWNSLQMHDGNAFQVKSDDVQCSSLDSTSSNQTLMASTQTVILLAEMASDSNELDMATQNSTEGQEGRNNRTVHFTLPQNEQQCKEPTEELGFVPEEHKKRQTLANEKLLKDFMTLLTSEQNADISIICRDGIRVPAHSLIIQARCPALFMNISGGQIMLEEFSDDCVQALLKYIYAADLSVPDSVAADLVHLAKRYDLAELGVVCAEAQLANNVSVDDHWRQEDPAVFSHHLIDRTLQNLLHDAWGSDSDADDEEQCLNSAKGDPASDVSHRSEELELDELYELVISQKHDSPSESEGGTEEEMLGSQSYASGDERSACDGGSRLNVALLKKLDDSFLSQSVRSLSDCQINQAKQEEASSDCVNGQVTSDSHSTDDVSDGEAGCKNGLRPNTVVRRQSKRVEHTPLHMLNKNFKSDETTPDLFAADNSDVDGSDADDSDAGADDVEDNDADVSDVDVDAVDASEAKADEDADVDESKTASCKQSCTASPEQDMFNSDESQPDQNDRSSDLSNTYHMDDLNMAELDHNLTILPSCADSQQQLSNVSEENFSQCADLPTGFSQKRRRSGPTSQANEGQNNSQICKRMRLKTKEIENNDSDRCFSSKPNSSTVHVSEDKEDLVDLTAEEDQAISGNKLVSNSQSPRDQLKVGHEQSNISSTDEQNLLPTESVMRSPTSGKVMSCCAADDSANCSDADTAAADSDRKCLVGERSDYSAVDIWDDFDDAGGYEEFDGPYTQVAHEDDSAAGSDCSLYNSRKVAGDDEDLPSDSETTSEKMSPCLTGYSCAVDRQSAEHPIKGRPDCNKDNEASNLLFKTPTRKPPLRSNATRQESTLRVQVLPAETADGDLLNELQPLSSDAESPVKSQLKLQPRKDWIPPSPFTPMSDYDNMSTPDLKKACHKMGIKALPKKKMIAVLKDIYYKTHSYETDTDYDGTPCKMSSRSAMVVDPCREARSSNCRKRVLTTKSTQSKQNVTSDKNTGETAASRHKQRTEYSQKSASDDDLDDDVMNSSQELNSSSSQGSSGTYSDLPEESILIVDDEEPKQKMSKKDEAFKRQVIWDFILANEELYLKILHYEPLDINSFHQQLKSTGLNVGVRIVMDFLDDQNILFTLKNQPKTHRKKKARCKGLSASQSNTQS